MANPKTELNTMTEEVNKIEAILLVIEPLSLEARFRVLNYVKEFIFHYNKINTPSLVQKYDWSQVTDNP